MGKYRKKPVVIDAVQLVENNVFQVLEFMGERPDLTHRVAQEKFSDYKSIVKESGLKINTLEGVMVASIGDYIIKGIKGEFYPCKPDIFEATYEPVEDEISEERWTSAIDNARFMLEEYKRIPNGVFGAMGIASTIARYDRGERTKELLEDLEGIE